MAENPFKPTAGKMPPILIGRQNVIDDFKEALANGAGSPGRLMLIVGPRGCGKTVMLTEFRKLARKEGWVTLSENASEGLMPRLVAALKPKGWRVESATLNPSLGIAGLATASLGGATVSFDPALSLTLREALSEALDSKKIKKGKGILITLDETQGATREDLTAISTAVQHIIEEQDETDEPDSDKKGIALILAGLPSLIDEYVNTDEGVITFLRRAQQRFLGDVPISDVKNAYIETFRDSGKTISEELALRCAELTDGYPYMIQLIGYYVWQIAQRDARDQILPEDLDAGYVDALRSFGDAVCAPIFRSLPGPLQEFLQAMTPDGEGPTKMADIEDRTGKSRSWVNKYREALIQEKVIEPAGMGYVKLAIPHMTHYLQRVQGRQE